MQTFMRPIHTYICTYVLYVTVLFIISLLHPSLFAQFEFAQIYWLWLFNFRTAVSISIKI